MLRPLHFMDENLTCFWLVQPTNAQIFNAQGAMFIVTALEGVKLLGRGEYPRE